MMNTPEEVIHHNFKGMKGSFIHDLHERNQFNHAAFKDYVQAIVLLTESAQSAEAVDRVLMEQVFMTYSYTLKSVMWHFDMNDQSVIDNLPEEQLFEYVDRLEETVRRFIQRKDVHTNERSK